jgi:signal peptidase I
MWVMKKEIIYSFTFLFVLIMLRLFLFEIYAISQNSMMNTYQSGDRVLILKNLYSIKQNNVFVFRYENDNVIKRCIGLPGDTLRILNGVIYLNSKKLKTPDNAVISEIEDDIFVKSNMFYTYDNNWSTSNFGPYIVPKKGMRVPLTSEVVSLYGRIINRDSLKVNPNIFKPVSYKEFYIFQHDYLFFVGDNRAESKDSRVFGPICTTDLKGKVIF